MVTTHAYDSLTEEQLSGVVGIKWTAYPDCIGAFIAEMDFGTAPCVVDALHATVDAGFYGYLPKALADDLAAACARWYKEECGWDVSPENIKALPDVLKGLEITLNHYSRPDAKVIVLTPAYMPFLSVPGFLGKEIIQVPMHQTDGRWEMDYAGIDAAFAVGGGTLILCNPHNPIGRVLTRDELLKVSEIVTKHNGRVFSDEIHAPVTFGERRHIPYASVSDEAARHTITAIAASKAWNLAGLKCAQLVLSNAADAKVWGEIGFFAGHGASTLGVIASIAAYNDGRVWLDGVRAYLDGNRKRLGELVAELLPGVTYVMPEGTYLAWLDFGKTGLDGDLATFFRDRAKVAINDGAACGEVGRGNVRFNFAMPRPLMERAVRQMADAYTSM